MISTSDIVTDPSLVSRRIDHNGDAYLLRLIAKDDADVFGEYLEGMGEKSRMFFGPHPLNKKAAKEICENLDPESTLRLGLFEKTGEMVGYFLIFPGVRPSEIGRYEKGGLPLSSDTDCTFAPSLTDRYQSKGIGSTVINSLYEIAAGMGFQRMVLSGGVQERNSRGVSYYTKNGFRRIGEFRSKTSDGTEINNIDMICNLTDVSAHDTDKETV